MSNLSDLKALYLSTGEAQLTDAVNLLEFKVALDRWYTFQLAADSFSDSTVQSYSIAGRSVTRAQLPQIREDAARLLAEVRAFLYGGGGGQIDMSGADWGKLSGEET